MKVERSLSLIFGLALVAIGSISLLGNTLLAVQAWRIWPLTVVILGMALCAPGFFGLKKRGLGSFFIAGVPVLATGGILLFASLFSRWDVWSLAWPLEVMGVALGFALAVVVLAVVILTSGNEKLIQIVPSPYKALSQILQFPKTQKSRYLAWKRLLRTLRSASSTNS